MAIYVVMEPPAADAVEAAERAVLIRDGFAFLAFLVPPLWLLWHRLWIEAALAFAVGVGLEGPALRINALRRRGWREWGAVEASGMAEAEIRYLAGEVPDVMEPPVPHSTSTQPRPSPSGLAAGPALGLFDYPGRR